MTVRFAKMTLRPAQDDAKGDVSARARSEIGAQRDDGIELRGFASRVHPEEDPHGDSDTEPGEDAPDRNA